MNRNVLGGASTKEERNFAMLAHLLGTVTHVFGALIIWLVKKDDSAFIAEEAKEALNFQITMLIGYVIGSGLAVVLIGFVILPVLYVLNIVFCILGAVAASKGQSYRYPFALRLVS
jgi:uncharacterized Tic20 family protein